MAVKRGVTAFVLRYRLVPTGEDGWIVVECPLIPGCISQGKTHDEALANIREAIEGHLETLRDFGELAPAPTTIARDVEILSAA